MPLAVAVVGAGLHAQQVVARQRLLDAPEGRVGARHDAVQGAAGHAGEQQQAGFLQLAIVGGSRGHLRLRGVVGRYVEQQHVERRAHVGRHAGQVLHVATEAIEHEPLRDEDHRFRPFEAAQTLEHAADFADGTVGLLTLVADDLTCLLLDVTLAALRVSRTCDAGTFTADHLTDEHDVALPIERERLGDADVEPAPRRGNSPSRSEHRFPDLRVVGREVHHLAG